MAPLTRSRAKDGSPSKSAKSKATKASKAAPKTRGPKPKPTAPAKKKSKSPPASPKTASPPMGRIATPKLSKTPKTPSPKKSKSKGKRKAKSPEPAQPLPDNDFEVKGDNLLAVPTDGPSYGRYLASDPMRLKNHHSRLHHSHRNEDGPAAAARIARAAGFLADFSPVVGPRRPRPADYSPLFGPRGLMPPDFSPLVGPRGPMPPDFSPLEGPGLPRGAGRGASPMPGFPVYGPGDVGAVLPRPEISPLDRPTRRTARDRVATPTIPQYAPAGPRRRSTRPSVGSPSAAFPPAPPPTLRRPSVATPTHRPARRPPPRGASVPRPPAAAAEDQRSQRPPIMQPLRPRRASSESVSPISPRPRRARHNRRNNANTNPNTAPSYIPITDSDATPPSSYVTARSHQSNSTPNPNPTEHAQPRQIRFRQPLTRDPITPRRFQRELQRLQDRLVTDPAEVNAIRRSRVERRMARAARAVSRERRREEEMRERARERQRVAREAREREIERERARVDARDAAMGVRRARNAPFGLGISGVPGL